MRRDSETAIGGRYTTRRVVLTPGAEYSATGVSLTALTERVHSDGAIPSKRNIVLLMIIMGMSRFWFENVRPEMRDW